MSKTIKHEKRAKNTIKVIIIFVLLFLIPSCKKIDKEDTVLPDNSVISSEENENDNSSNNYQGENQHNDPDEPQLILETVDEGNVFFYSSEGFYRYGPSIMVYDNGSMDMWLSSPGNSGSQWDWIEYRHSEDGINWSEGEIVLQPTSGSKDQCSVCDPAVIFFGDYYYMGYTATDYYAGKGTYNMAFVARSRYPDGPFEKWNGSGWGGSPEPIIFYDGGQDNWGIGEISFVVYEGDLCIYYTYIDVADRYIGLYKAGLTEDWPAALRNKGPVLYRLDQDSTEVVYDDNLQTFFAFTIENRMMEGSQVTLFESKNGKDFTEVAYVKDKIEDYAHNMGVAKNSWGHVNTENELLIGYAYGPNWGRWNAKTQHVTITKN